MIVVRIAKGIKDHFEIRFSEWAASYGLLALGVVLALDENTFDKSSSFAFMAQWADESVWALVLQLAALIRFAALTVNGTFKARFPWSPHIRGSTSLLSALLWGQILVGLTLGFFYANGPATGIAIYSMAFGMDVWNTFRCWAEVGRQSVYGRTY